MSDELTTQPGGIALAIQKAGEALSTAAFPVQEAMKNLEFNVQRKKTGEQTVQITTDGQTFSVLQNAMKRVQQIEAAYNDELQRNQQQEARVRGNPIMAVMTQLAGAFAQEPNMPADVRALGRANLALNPSMAELTKERMGILGAMEDSAMREAQLGSAIGAEEGRRVAVQRESRLAEQAKQKATADLQGKFAQEAKGRTFDPESAKAMAEASGMDPETARAMVEHYSEMNARSEQAFQTQQTAVSERDKAKADAQARLQDQKDEAAMQRTLRLVQSANAKLPTALKAPLGEKAVNWENAQGERADPLMTITEAVNSGYHPVGKISTADTRRASMLMLDQMFDLLPSMKKKGFLASSTTRPASALAGVNRWWEPGDPDLVAWHAHAGTMVSMLRQLGDIGPRAIAAFQSAINIVENPSTEAGARKALEQIRDAIKAAKPPAVGDKSRTQSSQDDPLGIR